MVETDYIFTRVVEDGQGLQLSCQSFNAGVGDLHGSRAVTNFKKGLNVLTKLGSATVQDSFCRELQILLIIWADWMPVTIAEVNSINSKVSDPLADDGSSDYCRTFEHIDQIARTRASANVEHSLHSFGTEV